MRVVAGQGKDFVREKVKKDKKQQSCLCYLMQRKCMCFYIKVMKKFCVFFSKLFMKS